MSLRVLPAVPALAVAAAIAGAATSAEAASAGFGAFLADLDISLSTTEGVSFEYDDATDVDFFEEGEGFADFFALTDPEGPLSSPDDAIPLEVTVSGEALAAVPGLGASGAFAEADSLLSISYTGEGEVEVGVGYTLLADVGAISSSFPASLGLGISLVGFSAILGGGDVLSETVIAEDGGEVGVVTEGAGEVFDTFSASDVVTVVLGDGDTLDLNVFGLAFAEAVHDPSSVPLPAGGALMLTGLAALGLLRRRG